VIVQLLPIRRVSDPAFPFLNPIRRVTDPAYWRLENNKIPSVLVRI
jgi:hypothetical protein